MTRKSIKESRSRGCLRLGGSMDVLLQGVEGEELP